MKGKLRMIDQKKNIPGVAMKFLNGEIDWAGQIFSNEEEFNKAVERAFKDEPPSPDPDVILIDFWREMKDIRTAK